jgi:hypothetical protein
MPTLEHNALVEMMLMERQTEGGTKFPPFMEALFERARREGELKGLREGKVDGLREALLRLTARAGIALSDGDRARIHTCEDMATLDRWIENVLGAKTAADILS